MSYNGAISNRDGVAPGREKVTCCLSWQVKCKICKLRVFLWNVGTIHGRANQVGETLDRRRIDICCF